MTIYYETTRVAADMNASATTCINYRHSFLSMKKKGRKKERNFENDDDVNGQL